MHRRAAPIALAVALAVPHAWGQELDLPGPAAEAVRAAEAVEAADPFADSAPAEVLPAAADPVGTVAYDAAADTVQVHVSDAQVVDVLRMLADQSRRNIIATREVGGTVTCDLYDVTVDEALDAILRGNGLAARQEGSFVYVYTRQQLDELDEAARRVETRVFRLYHTPPAMAATMVAPALSDAAVVSVSDDPEVGVGSDLADGGGYGYGAGDVLVVRDYPEHLDRVADVLRELDARPEQVLIEATILSTTLNEENRLGVDLNLVGGVDFASLALGGSQLTGAGLDDAGGRPAVTAGTGQNFTNSSDGGFKVGFVNGDVSAFVSALEGTTDTTVLANPKVLAVNKQKGEVLVGRKDGYITTTLTETAATQQVEFLETGTKLIFRPYVSRDGYIRLEIHPEDSSGGVDDRGLPSKVTTEVTTNVLVKDGHTVVIGGLFRETSSVGRTQVPILGNIPILGHAFRKQADTTLREEIIVLLTPHVVKDFDRYAELSADELRKAEKLRVGTRRGMMPWGRERMAQANYERAVRALSGEEPNTGSAKFYLNAALHLNPSFIEAIELKEQLTRRQVAEADGSSIRGFLRRAVAEDLRRAAAAVPPPAGEDDAVPPMPAFAATDAAPLE